METESETYLEIIAALVVMVSGMLDPRLMIVFSLVLVPVLLIYTWITSYNHRNIGGRRH